MPLPRSRYTIGRLMIVVAVAGMFCAWLLRVPGAGAGVVAGVLILGPPAIGLAYPVFFAEPGRRLLAANWLAAFWPLTFPWSIHAVWASSHVWLGHPPGPADNTPFDAILVLSMMAFGYAAIGASVMCLWLSWVLIRERVARGHGWFPVAFPIMVNLLAWGSALGICGLDPVGIGAWFAD